MAGSPETGRKAARTNKENHGETYYKEIQLLATKKWKENGRKPRGFSAMSPEKRKELSQRGVAARKRPQHDNGNQL